MLFRLSLVLLIFKIFFDILRRIFEVAEMRILPCRRNVWQKGPWLFCVRRYLVICVFQRQRERRKCLHLLTVLVLRLDLLLALFGIQEAGLSRPWQRRARVFFNEGAEPRYNVL